MHTKNDKKINEILLSFKKMMTESFFEDAKEFGFSPSHFEVLMYLSLQGTATMTDVAKWLNITPPSVSAIIEKLVLKKFIKRVNNDKDRRTIEISLGEEAHKLFAKLHKSKKVLFYKTLSKLNEKDKEDLIRIINKCIS